MGLLEAAVSADDECWTLDDTAVKSPVPLKKPWHKWHISSVNWQLQCTVVEFAGCDDAMAVCQLVSANACM